MTTRLKLKYLFKRLIWALVPSKLPVGLNALDAFSTETLAVYDIPTLPSYYHAIASMIMHLGPQQVKVKRSFIAASIRKAMANQVAFEQIQKLKEEQKAKEDAAKLATEQTVASEENSQIPA
jgi:hypothetical protein